MARMFSSLVLRCCFLAAFCVFLGAVALLIFRPLHAAGLFRLSGVRDREAQPFWGWETTEVVLLRLLWVTEAVLLRRWERC